MKSPILIIGLGELGSVFARGFLRLGYPVQALSRQDALDSVAQHLPAPEAVLIAVGEADLHPVLTKLPAVWKDRVILLQNELLPRDWLAHHLSNPTVISVWFEKKKGMDSKVVVPSPIFGPHAKLLFNALAQLDLPSFIVDKDTELLFELVRKNLYILTTNIAGLEVGGTVAQLSSQHGSQMRAVFADVLEIQSYLSGQTQASEPLLQAMLEAFAGDPNHQCMGRSAPARLARALQFADLANLEVPTLRAIAAKHLHA
ncbi:MAG: hypothetical protein JXR44_05500 [Thiotrichales bacterium]|nr:hypothetical protein [Thiotrichales bacterium]